MARFDPREIHAALAHDVHDDLAPDQVVGIECQPPLDREIAGFNGGVVLVKHFGVLAIGIADAADGRYAQRHQIAVGLRAVALKIPVHPAAKSRRWPS
ncbi:hypothetical protein G6F40_017338 [Rhizopus arrhizus]|nr:hypothetical protein G6F40_017338 [Rhizopus arrhizus]